jgi:hypothetical protein
MSVRQFRALAFSSTDRVRRKPRMAFTSSTAFDVPRRVIVNPSAPNQQTIVSRPNQPPIIILHRDVPKRPMAMEFASDDTLVDHHNEHTDTDWTRNYNNNRDPPQDWRELSTRIYHQQATTVNVFDALEIVQHMCAEQANGTQIIMNDFLRQVKLCSELTTNHMETIYQALKECYRHGWRPDMRTFDLLMDLCCIQKPRIPVDPNRAEAWLKTMWNTHRQHAEIQPTQKHYLQVFAAWTISDEPEAHAAMKRLLKAMRGHYQVSGTKSLKPTSDMYVAWAKALQGANVHDAAEQADEVLRELEENSTKDKFWPATEVYNAVLELWKDRGNLARAEEIFQTMWKEFLSGSNIFCRPSVETFNLLLAILERSKLPQAGKRAEELLHLMAELAEEADEISFAPTSTQCSAVVKCWFNTGSDEGLKRAEDFLVHMMAESRVNQSVQPDQTTLLRVVRHISNSHAVDAPERIERLLWNIQSMQYDNDDVKNAFIFKINSLRIRSLLKSDRSNALDKTQAILEKMLATQESQGTTTRSLSNLFNYMIRVCVKRGDLLRAQDILRRMRTEPQRGNSACAPSVYTYNAIIDGIANVRPPAIDAGDQAEELLNIMVDSACRTGVAPNLKTFDAIFKCWTVVGSLDSMDKPLALLQRIREGQAGEPPSVSTYKRVVDVLRCSTLAYEAKEAIAKRLIVVMTQDKLKPDEELVISFKSFCCKDKHL